MIFQTHKKHQFFLWDLKNNTINIYLQINQKLIIHLTLNCGLPVVCIFHHYLSIYQKRIPRKVRINVIFNVMSAFYISMYTSSVYIDI